MHLKVSARSVSKRILTIAASIGLIVANSQVEANTKLNSSQPSSNDKLAEFVEAYTFLYFALGACTGFINPTQEAQFDPYGPALAKWPDEFRKLMSDTRNDGRVEARKIAKRLTLYEQTELCESQIDSASKDIRLLVAKYGK